MGLRPWPEGGTTGPLSLTPTSSRKLRTERGPVLAGVCVLSSRRGPARLRPARLSSYSALSQAFRFAAAKSWPPLLRGVLPSWPSESDRGGASLCEVASSAMQKAVLRRPTSKCGAAISGQESEPEG